MESPKKEVKKVFVVVSEWDTYGERDFELNGVFLDREDAIKKFKSVVETERKNCSFINMVYKNPENFTYSEVYNEESGEWTFKSEDYQSWFEVHITEQDLM